METFLEHVIQQAWPQISSTDRPSQLIVANKRARLYLQEAIRKKASQAMWGPKIFTLPEWLQHFSPYLIADPILLIPLLHKTFQECYGTKEDLLHFYHWGELILNDFSEMDEALVDPDAFFSNLSTVRQYDLSFASLAPEQQEAIQGLQELMGRAASAYEKSFESFWNGLPKLYFKFNQKLKTSYWAYKGALSKWVADKIARLISNKNLQDTQFIFIGFTKLTKAEQVILSHLKQQGSATLFWDLDKSYVQHPVHQAGHFIRNLQASQSNDLLPQNFEQIIKQNTDLQIVKIEHPTITSQTRSVKTLITSLLQDGYKPDEIAIVLPDDSLLMNVLQALPKNIGPVNITMGYRLSFHPIYTFLDHWIRVQEYYLQNETTHAPNDLVEQLLNQSILNPQNLDLEGSNEEKYKNIQAELIKPMEQGHDFFNQLIHIIDQLNIDPNGTIPHIIWRHIQTLLEQLSHAVSILQIDLPIDVLLALTRHQLQHARVPIFGEPVSGLQIMGVLESQSIDFKIVIILSMNEGSFPPKSNFQTLIPFMMRQAFDLPTVQDKEGQFAYLLYRLLHRSQKLFLLYHTALDNGKPAEMSHFLHQFEQFYPDLLKNRYLQSTYKFGAIPPIIIPKDDFTVKQLTSYLGETSNDQKFLSPTAINTYFSCKLRFYFRYVAKIPEDEDKTILSPKNIGSLVHLVMEFTYKELVNKPLTQELLKQSINQLKSNVKLVIKNHFGLPNQDLEGPFYIIFEIVTKICQQIIKQDQTELPFQIQAVEQNLNIKIPIKTQYMGNNTVNLSGIIDRIDIKDDIVKIIDYKTGSDQLGFPDLTSLFDDENRDRNKATFQVLLYSLLYHKNNDLARPIQPNILNTNTLFQQKNQILKTKINNKWTSIMDARPLLEAFETQLRSILTEIFDTNTPFDQTKDRTTCNNCPYKTLCHRN